MDNNFRGNDKFLTKAFASVAGGLVLMTAVFGSFYTVDQTEMANVKRFGKADVTSPPIGPGLHFKMPLIDSVDRLQVSQRMLHIPPFSVNTIDNQQITLDLNFNYTVPAHKVNHLLYEIGRGDATDIDANIIPIAMDQARQVFQKQNTTMVSEKGDEIQAQVTKQVFDAVTQQFGIQPHSLQFAKISYSETFVKSNENAVKAKNDAIAEQNKKVVEQAKADQMVITAKGAADSRIEEARGQSESVLLNAKADKTKQILDGEGQSKRLQMEIAALGGPENYIKYLNAKAANNWDGVRPQVESTGGASTPIVVPVAPRTPKAPTPGE